MLSIADDYTEFNSPQKFNNDLEEPQKLFNIHSHLQIMKPKQFQVEFAIGKNLPQYIQNENNRISHDIF
jgi:hypothetical protein